MRHNVICSPCAFIRLKFTTYLKIIYIDQFVLSNPSSWCSMTKILHGFLSSSREKANFTSRGSIVHCFSLLLRILKFAQHFPFVAGWAWSVSVQTCFPFRSSFARMAHCYGCRVEIIIIIFVQVVLDVVDKSTVLTDSFHFFTYLSFSDLLKC